MLENTAEKIKDLIDPASVNKLTRLIIVSTILFKGLWKKPFEHTATDLFDQKFQTDFMTIQEKRTFNIAETEEFSGSLSFFFENFTNLLH